MTSDTTSAMNSSNAMATERENTIRRVTLNFDQAHLAQLPENRRNLLQAVEFELNDLNLTTPLVYQVQLPLHQADQNDDRRNFGLSDLFLWAASIDEPQSLAIDEHGEKKFLSTIQFESVREEAQLCVQSRKYPDRYHVWKLNRIIQEGRRCTKTIFEETISSSLDYLIVSIPENIFDNSDHTTLFSAQKGVKIIHRGILAMLSSVVGFVEEKPKHEPYEVSRMVEEKRIEFIVKSIAADSFLDTSIFRSCLYDKELTKTVEADLVRIHQDNHYFWSSNQQMLWKQSFQKMTITYPEADRDTPNFLTDRVNEDLENQKHETLNDFFRSDVSLNEICPGYGILLANQYSAAKITCDEEKKRQQLIMSNSIAVKKQISQQYPILSRIEGWVAPRFNRQVEVYAKESEVTMKNEISRKLLDSGLHLELHLVSESLKFEKEEGESYRQQLSCMKIPTKIIYFPYRIWRSKNYIRTQNPYTSTDEPRYIWHDHVTTEIPTNRLFWRWNVMFHRVKYFLNDGLYGVLVENLLNSALGLRAMGLSSRGFNPQIVMDNRRGEILCDRTIICSTYRGNLEATLIRYHTARSAFEGARDEGLLGKGITRPFFVFYQLLVCTASVLVIGVGQPLLTICNLAVSILITATAPVWAVFLSVFLFVFSFTVADIDYPYAGHYEKRTFFYSPIPSQALYVLFMGLGQIIFKVAQCVVFDFPMFLLEGIYAPVRYGLRKVWDAMMMSILKSRMKVPGVDSFWAKRIKGPGLSNKYFYQVDPEVAIAALQVTLETEELDFYVVKEKAEIKKPLKDFNDFFKHLLAPLTINASMLPETFQLEDEERKNLVTLDSVTRARYKTLAAGSLHRGVINTDRIKLSTENLDDTLARSQEIVTTFYKERVSQYINVDTSESMAYWRGKSLFEDDFKGLTAYYYGKTFHGDFLVPLEATDEDFIVRVIQPSLDDIVTHFPYSYQQNTTFQDCSFMPPPVLACV